jgi:hypothetical protein
MYQEMNKELQSDSLENEIFSIENSLKVYRGELKGLKDPCNLARKDAFHTMFRDEVLKNPELRADTIIWEEISRLNAERKKIYDEVNLMSPSSSIITGQLMQNALAVVALAVNYPDTSGTASIRATLSSKDDPDEMTSELSVFEMYLRETLNKLGPGHPFVVTALNGRTPETAAREILSRTRMGDNEFRKTLLSMDSTSVWNVNDPLVELAKIAYTRGNELVILYQTMETMLVSRRQRLGQMVFELYGTRIPPDATFSLRINDGVVNGYDYNGTIAPPVTTFYGLYDRFHSFKGEFPYNLPRRWQKAESSLLSTPMNFVSSNDIVGGNSGSPIINSKLEVVGLAFDGNIESLLGRYIYIPEENRCVGVHSAGIIGALRHVYKAKRLVSELEK